LLEPRLTVPGYPALQTPAIQPHVDFPWNDTVDLWIRLNRLLIHVLRRIPASQLDMPCRLGNAAPISLQELIDRYIQHCQDILRQSGVLK
jgi:hypothetical protein